MPGPDRRRRPSRRPAPVTRAERRAAVARRRGVAMLVGSAAAAAVVLTAWFPASALIAQRHTLAQTATTLGELRAQDKALRLESKNLSNPSEIARIARQQFGLITPGEQAYQVLPPPGAGSAATLYPGDPGLAAPVSPSAAAELPPGSVSTGSHASGSKDGTTSGSPGLFTRLLQTLEFWR